MEMLVKPGIVLIFVEDRCGVWISSCPYFFCFWQTAGSMRKSTRARPAQSQARKAAMSHLADLPGFGLAVSFAGMMGMDGFSGESAYLDS